MRAVRAAGLALLLLAALAAACRREEPRLGLGVPVPDAEVAQLYADLTDGDDAAAQRAADRIVALPDRRFVAPLIELVRASQWGTVGQHGINARIVALERLTGQSLGADWFGWADWYQGTELSPPQGFAGWKAQLFAPIDARFAELLRDGVPARIRVEEIDWGGAQVEGIPALDAPAHADLRAAGLDAGEPVVGVALAGEARAYPLRVLEWHEVVNDTLGGRPVALLTCPLASASVVYDASDGRGGARRFSTSGLVHRSNRLVFDRETKTLWGQLTGEAVLGPLAGRPERLVALPSVVTTLGAWQTRHPDTTVLSIPSDPERDYRIGVPYGPYYQSPRPMFPVHERRAEVAPKERVYGIVRGGAAKAWRFAEVAQQQVVNDSVGDFGVVLVAEEGRILVEGRGGAGFLRYEAGGAVRSYVRGERAFGLGPDEETLVDADGAPWRIEEDALVGPGGARAERVDGRLAYWFAWQAFHPDTEVVAEPREEVESDLEF